MQDPADLRLTDWRPRSQLVAAVHEVPEPAFPVVDVHNHVGRWLSPDDTWLIEPEALSGLLDDAGVEMLVNLDGRWGSELRDNLARYDEALPGRVVTFCHPHWALLADSGGPHDTAVIDALTGDLAASAAAGARGVKIWKDLGLGIRDGTGSLVAVDDPRTVAVCRAAGELALPVLIHTADPVAFFEPLDAHNERIEELTVHPDWWFGSAETPTFDALIDALHRLVAACPATTFIGAHVGGHAEDLTSVGAALHRLPNWHVDTGGRMAELGRQPRAFRRLVESFPDRVLFGSDCFPPDLATYRRWWRFLETEDEGFGYVEDDEVPPQGRWAVSAVGLPKTLLGPLYRENAQRLLAR